MKLPIALLVSALAPLGLFSGHAAPPLTQAHALKDVAALRPTVSLTISGPSSITSAGTYTWDLCISGSPSGVYQLTLSRVGGSQIKQGNTLLPGNPCISGSLTISGGPNFQLSGVAYNSLAQEVASTTYNVTVDIPQPLSATILGPSVIPSMISETWDANPAGGTAPYTYEWQDGSTSSEFSGSFPDHGVAYDTTLTLDVWDSASSHVHVTQSVRVCPSPEFSC